jgi:hypothetical protein
VRCLAWLLNACGYGRFAPKLLAGYAGWELLNSPKYDFNLTFKCGTAQVRGWG